MKKNKDRIKTIKEILNHKQSKEIQRKSTFEKQSSLHFEDSGLYKREKDNNPKGKQEFANLIKF